jgi:heme-degrading monooxygenase HmoA
MQMIGRLWRGLTSTENASAYENVLRTMVVPEVDQIPGSRGALVLRRDVDDGVEFVTLTMFESLDAVKSFAGEDYERAKIIPEAEALLASYEPTAIHYEIAIELRRP